MVGKSCNPVLQEGDDDVLRTPVGLRDGFTPSSEAIHGVREETLPT